MCYLLCLSILGGEGGSAQLNPSLLPRLKLAVFGCPRIGNLALAQHWRDLSSPHSIHEYSVKAYNDDVTALPPSILGYRHFCQNPIYFAQGHLFRIPPDVSECSHFPIKLDDDDAAAAAQKDVPPEFPRGGHNYYNGRDMEGTLQKIWRLKIPTLGEVGWEERHRGHLRRGSRASA